MYLRALYPRHTRWIVSIAAVSSACVSVVALQGGGEAVACCAHVGLGLLGCPSAFLFHAYVHTGPHTRQGREGVEYLIRAKSSLVVRVPAVCRIVRYAVLIARRGVWPGSGATKAARCCWRSA